MRYFIDTEFIEGFHKPLFGKRRHFIDLISIGIFCEDGREFYAISNEWNYKDADSWVKENVLKKLPSNTEFRYRNNSMIANDVQGFVYGGGVGIEHEFYGYYSDYDWVLFCSLFGRMIDLPKDFPMYCRDLKQSLDEKADAINQLEINYLIYNSNLELLKDLPENSIKDISDWTFDQKLTMIKSHKDYPKQQNEHSAIDDAKWNYELYKFIQTL